MIEKIVVGYAPKNHVKLAFDEINGLRKIGIHCEPVIYGRNDYDAGKIKKLSGVIYNAIKIVSKLYKFSPDLLYLNSRFEKIASTRDFISVFLIRLLYRRKLKIAIKTHGSDLEFLASSSAFDQKTLLPYLIKNVDLWLFLSQEEKDTINLHNSYFGSKVVVTSNIIDPSRSLHSPQFREQYNIKPGKFLFLYVGRIVREKGVFTIIESIPLFKHKENCIFCFVGDGPHLNELTDLANELNLNQYVHFTGFIIDEECDHFYTNADALVFPTYFTEGFPMALFKSVAAGLPIITTATRAAKDHLKDPDNVLWVDGRSATSVTNALNELYANNALRSQMADNNKKLAQRFSAEEVCKQMKEAFEMI